jgi:hypothetical protein
MASVTQSDFGNPKVIVTGHEAKASMCEMRQQFDMV